MARKNEVAGFTPAQTKKAVKACDQVLAQLKGHARPRGAFRASLGLMPIVKTTATPD